MFLKNLADSDDRETPKPSDPIEGKIGIIVGHTKRKSGAVSAAGISEYQFNSELAAMIKNLRPNNVKIFKRDGIGIRGAYKEAEWAKCDVIVELHFNAFNAQVAGTETLCTTDPGDKALAKYVHRRICTALKRGSDSRGVKPITRSSSGGINVYQVPTIANCLVEPFFGDNPREWLLAEENKTSLAAAILGGATDYIESRL